MHVDDSVKNRQQVLSTTLALYQMPESSLVSTRAPIWTSAQLMAHAPSTAARDQQSSYPGQFVFEVHVKNQKGKVVNGGSNQLTATRTTSPRSRRPSGWSAAPVAVSPAVSHDSASCGVPHCWHTLSCCVRVQLGHRGLVTSSSPDCLAC